MTIARGVKLAIHLDMPGLEIVDPIQHLMWHGRPEAVQFCVAIPEAGRQRSVIGTVTISRGGVPLGHIKFKLNVTTEDAAASQETVPSGIDTHRYRKAFISYASPDRAEVLKRVQMLRHANIEFFQDLLDLEPGDRWEKALYRHIDDSDLFLLFWSNAARQSKWVLEEVRYALRRKDSDELRRRRLNRFCWKARRPRRRPRN